MKNLNTNRLSSERGVANIMIAIFSSAFVASMILPLAAYHQNSLRVYMANKTKLESLEDLERTSKAVLIAYQSSPPGNRTVTQVGSSSPGSASTSSQSSGGCGEGQSKWGTQKSCFTEGGSGSSASSGLSNYSYKNASAQMLVPTSSTNINAALSSGNVGAANGTQASWNGGSTGSTPSSSSPGASQSGNSPVLSPGYPGATYSPYPVEKEPRERIPPNDPKGANNKSFDRGSKSSNSLETGTSWDTKFFVMMDFLFPQVDNLISSDLFVPSAAASVSSGSGNGGASGSSSASSNEKGMGLTPKDWMSNSNVNATVQVDVTNGQRDLFLSCGDTFYRCVEVQICPQSQTSGCTKPEHYFKQQVMLYN